MQLAAKDYIRERFIQQRRLHAIVSREQARAIREGEWDEQVRNWWNEKRELYPWRFKRLDVTRDYFA